MLWKRNIAPSHRADHGRTRQRGLMLPPPRRPAAEALRNHRRSPPTSARHPHASIPRGRSAGWSGERWPRLRRVRRVKQDQAPTASVRDQLRLIENQAPIWFRRLLTEVVSECSGPNTRSRTARACSERGRAASSSPWSTSRLSRLVAVSGWSGPSARSEMARARSKRGRGRPARPDHGAGRPGC